jgi:hypothetical protein
VREFADPVLIVEGARGTDDARRVARVRLPERHLGDAVRLRGDALREPERLEGLHAAGLDAVRLPDLEPAAATVDHASRDVRELRELSRGDHAGRAGADDQDVDGVGQFVGAVDADAGGGFDAGIARHVTAVMELGQHASIFAHHRPARAIARLR